MNSEVEQIKSRLNVVDVLGEYIKLDKAGANWRAVCPFHNEKSPSFMVNEEKQFWHCFGCQKSGDIFTFVMEMEGLDFREALKQLADKAGVEIKDFNPKKAEEKNRTLEILELSVKWYDHQLWNGAGKTKALPYLRERGLTDEIIKFFRLGYAPDGWRNILPFLLSRGYAPQEIERSGLLVKKDNSSDYYDRFRDRIMFPIFDYSGRAVGYSARVSPGADESQAKYVNTPETESYHKSQILYGLDKAKTEIKKMDYVLLVEGNMDVIAASQAGMKNVIAVSGTALTEEQINIIKRYTKNVKMFFDMDNAGIAATKKSVRLAMAADMTVKIVTLPSGKDAADLAKDNPEELRIAVKDALSVMDYFFQKTLEKYDRNKVEDKKKITEEILEMISSFESEVEKSHWIKKLSDLIEVPETALTNELKKASLRSRIVNREIILKEDSLAVEKSKEQLLFEELSGFCLVSKEAWAAVENMVHEISVKDVLLEKILTYGKKVGYSFDGFIKEISQNRELVGAAEKAYSNKKYQLDLNNNVEEVVSKDFLSDALISLCELKKEQKKQALLRLTRDLKLAEEKKDREAIKFLKEEFNKISQELSSLVN